MLMIDENEMFLTHDVVFLITNTTIDDTLHILKERLQVDSTLQQRDHFHLELFQFVVATT